MTLMRALGFRTKGKWTVYAKDFSDADGVIWWHQQCLNGRFV